MIRTSTMGMPRVGKGASLSKVLKKFYNKEIEIGELLKTKKEICEFNLLSQKNADIDIIPCNDFSFVDHVLDATCLFGNIPRRYYWEGGQVPLDIYFAMVNGQQKNKFDVNGMEINRWFNTFYEYIVPEFSDSQDFAYSDNKPIMEYLEAKKLGIKAKPIILGPITYILSGKIKDEDITIQELSEDILQVFSEIFANMRRIGIDSVQIDEPCLVTDLSKEEQSFYKQVYDELRKSAGNMKICLATYYGDLGSNTELTFSLPIDSLHIDLCAAPNQLDDCLNSISNGIELSLGLVNGQNVWINDLENSVAIVEKVARKIGEDRTIVSTSCPLIHCPLDLRDEKKIDKELQSQLSFAIQKLNELKIIKHCINGTTDKDLINAYKKNHEDIKLSHSITRTNIDSIDVFNNKNKFEYKRSQFSQRYLKQREKLCINSLPTTTIGGMIPSGEAVNSKPSYKDKKFPSWAKKEIKHAIKMQEDAKIDIISIGEPWSDDDIGYLASHMEYIWIPENSFVQKFGSNVSKVPIIYGKPELNSNPYKDYVVYALHESKKPLKLSTPGPVTFVKNSFCREGVDVYNMYSYVSNIFENQIKDLEEVGLSVIQIDESLFKEALPIRYSLWSKNVNKIINPIKNVYSDLKDDTQIQIHMANSNFNDIIEDIAKLDADVLLLENFRSQMEILDCFVSFKYPNAIGLGVFDVTSVCLPNKHDIHNGIKKSLRVLELEQLWVCPDSYLHDYYRKDDLFQVIKMMVEITKEIRGKSF